MQGKPIERRALMQTLIYGIGAAAVGRVIAACSSDPDPITKSKPDDTEDPGPVTDKDEQVPGTSPPVDATDDNIKLPNQVFETRVKQLEAEQQRIYSRGVFMRGDAGIMAGKETSHEPKPSIVMENGKKRIEVVVNHVMGKNALDAGPVDAATVDAKADATTDAGKTDAGDAGDAGVIDAGAPVVHFITTIYLRGQVNGVDTVLALWEFLPTDAAPPTVRFSVPAGVTSVVAYEWCTLHGLWKSPDLAV